MIDWNFGAIFRHRHMMPHEQMKISEISVDVGLA